MDRTNLINYSRLKKAFFLPVSIVALIFWANTALADETMAPVAVAGEGKDSPFIRLEPSTIILGRTQEVAIEISIREEAGDPPLRASVNVGILSDIEPVEPGVYKILYKPPRTRFPQIAVIALWRETGPEATVSFFRIPLLGSASIPITTSPGAKVRVSLQGHDFGPYEAGEDGGLVARLVVPPGVSKATVTALTEEGETRSHLLDLAVPPYNRLTLALVPHSVIADGISPVRLHLYYDDTGRGSLDASSFVVQTGLVQSRPVEHLGGPLYMAEYIAPLGTQDGEVEFRAGVRGDRGSAGSVQVNVGRQIPANLKIEPSSLVQVANGSSFVEFNIIVRDALGLGVSGLSVEADSSMPDLLQDSKIQEKGSGEYSFSAVPKLLEATNASELVDIVFQVEDLSASARVELLPWLPEKILVEPEYVDLSADGKSECDFIIQAFDHAHTPMNHLVPVVRAVDGTISDIRIYEEGGYIVTYRAPYREYGYARGEEISPPSMEDSIRIEIGSKLAEAKISLSPLLTRRWSLQPSFELSGGYQTNLDMILGPILMLHSGLWLFDIERFSFFGSVWSGFSFSKGNWDLNGTEEQTLSAKLMGFPLLAEFFADLPLSGWSMGLGLGGGVLYVPGSISIPGAEDISISSALPAMAIRIRGSKHLRYGRITLNLFAIETTKKRHGGGADFSGRAGGIGATIGYGVEP